MKHTEVVLTHYARREEAGWIEQEGGRKLDGSSRKEGGSRMDRGQAAHMSPVIVLCKQSRLLHLFHCTACCVKAY